MANTRLIQAQRALIERVQNCNTGEITAAANVARQKHRTGEALVRAVVVAFLRDDGWAYEILEPLLREKVTASD